MAKRKKSAKAPKRTKRHIVHRVLHRVKHPVKQATCEFCG